MINITLNTKFADFNQTALYYLNKNSDVRKIFSDCHAFITNFYYKMIYLEIPHKHYKLINQSQLNKIYKKYEDIGIYCKVGKRTKINKNKKLLIFDLLKTRQKFNNTYTLILAFELARLLVKYPLLIKYIKDNIERYPKMNIWEIFYITMYDKDRIKFNINSYFDLFPVNRFLFLDIDDMLNFLRKINGGASRAIDNYLPKTNSFNHKYLKKELINDKLNNQIKKIDFKIYKIKHQYFKNYEIYSSIKTIYKLKNEYAFTTSLMFKTIKVNYNTIKKLDKEIIYEY